MRIGWGVSVEEGYSYTLDFTRFPNQQVEVRRMSSPRLIGYTWGGISRAYVDKNGDAIVTVAELAAAIQGLEREIAQAELWAADVGGFRKVRMVVKGEPRDLSVSDVIGGFRKELTSARNLASKMRVKEASDKVTHASRNLGNVLDRAKRRAVATEKVAQEQAALAQEQAAQRKAMQQLRVVIGGGGVGVALAVLVLGYLALDRRRKAQADPQLDGDAAAGQDQSGSGLG